MQFRSPTRTRTFTPRQALQTVLTVLLAAGMGAFAAGCDAVGSDDGDSTDTTAPAAPSSLKGESKDAMIELTWEATGAEDLEGYNVYRGTAAGVEASGTPLVQGRTETSYVDESVENGTTYYYVVTAVDAAGNESNPSAVLEKTAFPGPPDQPEE